MTATQENPYAWSSPRPGYVLERKEIKELAKLLASGKTVLLHAGRGMGKSVTLHALESWCGVEPYTLLRVDGPDGKCLSDVILAGLKLSAGQALKEALDECLRSGTQFIVLIDEIDAWVRPDQRATTQIALDQLAKLSREYYPGQLGVLVAGGVGNTLLAHSPWGSTFASRVERTVYLAPFSELEIEALVEPLAARRTLSKGWLRELSQASGGIPALVCQALEAAWDDETLWPLEHLADWIKRQDGFRRAVLSSISVDELDGPWRLLQVINAAQGELPVDEVQQAVGGRISPEHALRVLVSAGLVHTDHDTAEDPWRVRPNPSVLHLGFPILPRAQSPIEALYADLRGVCAELRRHAADLFHGKTTTRMLVPEATITGMVSMFLLARGWTVKRELQQVAGRTDLHVSGRRIPGHVIIEVKIWGRNDYRGITTQLKSYAMAPAEQDQGTFALIAIMIAEGSVDPQIYEATIRDTGICVGGFPAEWEGAVVGPAGNLPMRHFLVSDLRRGSIWLGEGS